MSSDRYAAISFILKIVGADGSTARVKTCVEAAAPRVVPPTLPWNLRTAEPLDGDPQAERKTANASPSA